MIRVYPVNHNQREITHDPCTTVNHNQREITHDPCTTVNQRDNT